jgi:hypothetical protein
MADERRTTEPHDRLTCICGVMIDQLEAHPEHRDGDKCVTPKRERQLAGADIADAMRRCWGVSISAEKAPPRPRQLGYWLTISKYASRCGKCGRKLHGASEIVYGGDREVLCVPCADRDGIYYQLAQRARRTRV